jgi:DNA-binding winged helix-turn-helix (wHTH) protein/tetratricopeptide (TPR) repeat protein
MGEIFQFGEFRIDPLDRTLRRNESAVPLHRRAFDVLLYLVQNPGRVVTKDELLKNVWPDAFVDENNLTQSISVLRKALDQRHGENSYITTLPGRGYQFIVPVQVVGQHETIEQGIRTRETLGAGGVFLQQRTVTTSVVTEERHQHRAGSSFRWIVLLALIAGFVAIGLAGEAAWKRLHPKSSLATVVLTDFVNSTGDATFDHTLKRALEIDLEQSPYMDVLSERAGVSTLLFMGKKSDTPVTADIGQEICERTNRQALLAGTISSVGKKYLLTLEASSCSTGKQLASAKAEARSKEEVLGALDAVAERVRRGLNESAESVESYEVPLRVATTPSLEALRAYSIGKYLQSQGKSRSEVMAAFQRAVDLDPQFAMAYRELAVENVNSGQSAIGAQYFKKALDLSDHISAYEQFLIRAGYYAYGQRDLIAGIKASQILASAYPQEVSGTVNVVDEYLKLGQYGPAITTAERGIKLFPTNALLYENLAEAYKDANRFDDCKAATLMAARVGKGDTGLHLDLFEIALAEHDQNALAQETQWFETHEDGTTVSYFPSFRGGAAATEGRYRQARDLFQGAYENAERVNLPETADKILIDEALVELKVGLPAASRATLDRIHPSDAGTPDDAQLRAELGDTSAAQLFLSTHSNPSPDTLLTYVDLPRVRAVLALQRGKPTDAIAALELARPYELRDYNILSIRAEAYLRAAQPGMAINEYRKILANPGIDPTSILYPFAHLGLARSYAMLGNTSASRNQYEAFLSAWKDADRDLPALKEANTELARLGILRNLHHRFSRQPDVRQSLVHAAAASSSEEKTPNRLSIPTILKVLDAKLEGFTSFVSPPTWRLRLSVLTTAPIPEESINGISCKSRMI